MINLPIFITYIAMAIILFIVTFFTKYKWIPILFGCLILSLSILSFFIKEIDLYEYFSNWFNIFFWSVFIISYVLGVIFLLNDKLWFFGLISGICLLILTGMILISVFLFGFFPLLPGASILFISFFSIISSASLGIIIGKNVSDKKNNICIPYLSNCYKKDKKKIN